MQGIVSGLSIAAGYAVGAFCAFVAGWMTETTWPKKPEVARLGWRILYGLGPVLFLIGLPLGIHWQNEVRRLMGVPAEHYRSAIAIALVTLLVAAAFILLGRVLRRTQLRFSSWLNRYVPVRVSIVLSLLVMIAFFFWIITGVAATFLINQADRLYATKNHSTPAGVVQPTSLLRSGSVESLVSWQSLGYQGKKFVAGGPTKQQLQNFTGGAVKQPIRVYVGLDSAATPETRAKLAVAELKRTGAFQRKVLVVADATGTGWLEPQSMDSLEYMYGGDTAIVSQQYSYLPSWISFLVDKQRATDTGTALFDAIRGEWGSMPANARPKLITYGLSLGSYGGQAAFGGVNDIRYSTNGAFFEGTPHDTRLWKTLTNTRQKGSPEWQPVYGDGSEVHFATSSADIAKQQGWQPPRVLYVQHASDPIVWFDFGLLVHRPDWLKEKRGPDVSPDMHWYPVVTFLQVAVDQFRSTSVPVGHGHNYSDDVVAGWAAVTQPPNWTAAKSHTLQQITNQYTNQ